MTAALEGGEWLAARPGRNLPPVKTRYPFYRRLGGPQGRSGRAGKSRPRRDSIPDRPACSSVAIPTELPGPHYYYYYCFPTLKTAQSIQRRMVSEKCVQCKNEQNTTGLQNRIHCVDMTANRPQGISVIRQNIATLQADR